MDGATGLWCFAAWEEGSNLMSGAWDGAGCCLGGWRGAWGCAGAGDDKEPAGVEGVGSVRLAAPADALDVKELLLGVPTLSHHTELMSNKGLNWHQECDDVCRGLSP